MVDELVVAWMESTVHPSAKQDSMSWRDIRCGGTGSVVCRSL
jgi:hypothetical protein